MAELTKAQRRDCWVLKTCPDCHFGRIPAGVFGPEDCPRCEGTSRVVVYGSVPAGRIALEKSK